MSTSKNNHTHHHTSSHHHFNKIKNPQANKRIIVSIFIFIFSILAIISMFLLFTNPIIDEINLTSACLAFSSFTILLFLLVYNYYFTNVTIIKIFFLAATVINFILFILYGFYFVGVILYWTGNASALWLLKPVLYGTIPGTDMGYTYDIVFIILAVVILVSAIVSMAEEVHFLRIGKKV
ncbi:MAG: hypothetical protein LBD05_00610 [Mycoplasmataceae bacterium]|nr:hypothetical protein [Mycoplasmataceae bacterium]